MKGIQPKEKDTYKLHKSQINRKDTDSQAHRSLIAMEEENLGNVKRQLAKLFEESLKAIASDEPVIEPSVAASTGKHGDYQCNNAMGLLCSKIKGKEGKKVKKGSENIDAESMEAACVRGYAIIQNLPQSKMVESCSVTGFGFVNVVLSKSWMAKTIHKMLLDGIETWAPQLPVKRVVVDFSSPNIAKEMHVGHLRSTIIGDTIARMLEFSNVEVLRRNHVGDWGTQFGMLIESLLEKFPDSEDFSRMAIGDLQVLYKESNKRFKDDPEFKESARKAVVRLQSGKAEYWKYRTAWEQICEVSRKEFGKIYLRLGVELEEKGESFYNQYIPGVIKELTDKGLLIKEKESESKNAPSDDKEEESNKSIASDALVIPIEGSNIPLIVVKNDGGYNYATTDLAALWYRLNEEKAEWVIYVTGNEQKDHLDMIFKAAKGAGWFPDDDGGASYPKASHVGFGLVCGADGKPLRTRCTEVVRLVDLLDEAKNRSKTALINRARDKSNEWDEDELERTAKAVGYGAVKYADLKNNRRTDYKFDFDQMLNDKGNTAVYLLYAHARICSIMSKSGKNLEELKETGEIVLDHVSERALGLHLLKFSEIVEEACTTLLPNVLCEYLYNLSEIFTKFYSDCKVVGSPAETSRLLLCEATTTVMRKCFNLLGIEPVYKL